MATVRLVNLHCTTPRRAACERDCSLIKVWGKNYFQYGPVGMHSGKDWSLNHTLPFGLQARIEVWEVDLGAWCPHDNDHRLGTLVIKPPNDASGQAVARFQNCGAEYLLTYEIVPDRGSSSS